MTYNIPEELISQFTKKMNPDQRDWNVYKDTLIKEHKFTEEKAELLLDEMKLLYSSNPFIINTMEALTSVQTIFSVTDPINATDTMLENTASVILKLSESVLNSMLSRRDSLDSMAQFPTERQAPMIKNTMEQIVNNNRLVLDNCKYCIQLPTYLSAQATSYINLLIDFQNKYSNGHWISFNVIPFQEDSILDRMECVPGSSKFIELLETFDETPPTGIDIINIGGDLTSSLYKLSCTDQSNALQLAKYIHDYLLICYKVKGVKKDYLFQKEIKYSIYNNLYVSTPATAISHMIVNTLKNYIDDTNNGYIASTASTLNLIDTFKPDNKNICFSDRKMELMVGNREDAVGTFINFMVQLYNFDIQILDLLAYSNLHLAIEKIDTDNFYLYWNGIYPATFFNEGSFKTLYTICPPVKDASHLFRSLIENLSLMIEYSITETINTIPNKNDAISLQIVAEAEKIYTKQHDAPISTNKFKIKDIIKYCTLSILYSLFFACSQNYGLPNLTPYACGAEIEIPKDYDNLINLILIYLKNN